MAESKQDQQTTKDEAAADVRYSDKQTAAAKTQADIAKQDAEARAAREEKLRPTKKVP